MWERFSYYGMRALLVLSMVAATQDANPGFGWSNEAALKLYAWYTSLVFFTPLLGGWIADKYLGQRNAVILGGLIMAAGQFVLGFSFGKDLPLFYVGLLMLILGCGLFKANIATMVGQLYAEGDVRRDSAFTIYYMGINLGACIAPFICSTLGEDPHYGWRFGYYAAGCGMLLSVFMQLCLARRLLGDVGHRLPAQRLTHADGIRQAALSSEERDRLKVIFMLFMFVVLFWAAFEQAGGLLNLFAANKTDRLLAGFEIPSGWFQSLGPFFTITLAPVFSLLWVRVGRSAGGQGIPTPMKMMLGLLLTALGFLCMVAAVFDHGANGKASMLWLVLAYMFNAMGELCISPVGLSLVSKLAPLRMASLMMGVWYLTNFVANLLAGYIGAFAAQAGELLIFGGLVGTLCGFALALWLLSGKLIDWMHGAESVTH
jgi:POT family proton-dependent oligopeptide transporter